MLTFKKGEDVKFIDPNSDLIPLLEADGWVVELKEVPTEKAAKKNG